MAAPLRVADWTSVEDRIRRWKAQPLRYWPLAEIAPALAGAHGTAERYLGRRDGLLIALALEAYRHQNGQYPASLAPLAPDFLHELPVDRITGGPLHYRLSDGRPLIYSVGADGDDDGGKVTVNRSNVPDPDRAARWDQRREEAADGDWRLFPSQPQIPPQAPADPAGD
jgi:hypothetical protein